MFTWPDKAILLLIEMYREKEEEFSSGFKRSNKIWAEIAAEMNKINPAYEVTAQQCTSKMSGLKRTYKNIVDMNKKSGNNRNSWAFFSVRFICTYTHILLYATFISVQYIFVYHLIHYSYYALGYGLIIWRQSVH